jgi:hypothetical protein
VSNVHRATRHQVCDEIVLNSGPRASVLPSMLDQGVWAEVKVGGEHLRLFSEQSALGVHASVYNVSAKSWIAPSEAVDDIEQGKDRAVAHAMTYLRRVANVELPPLTWKKSRSA